MSGENDPKEREVVIPGKHLTGSVVSFMEENVLPVQFRDHVVKVVLSRTVSATGMSARYVVDVHLYEWPWKDGENGEST